jgi:hypothetical protein
MFTGCKNASVTLRDDDLMQEKGGSGFFIPVTYNRREIRFLYW